MRTFGPQHFNSTASHAGLLAAALATALATAFAAAPLAAQQRAPADLTPTARIIPARCGDAACGGDYQLAIVAALYPYDDGVVRGPSVLTLVIENRGKAAAPLAALDVAPVTPQASFVVARRAPVAALLPGERTVVEIPLTLDADGGAPCLAVTVVPGVVPSAAQQLFYASGSPGGSSIVSPSLAPPPFVSIVDDGL